MSRSVSISAVSETRHGRVRAHTARIRAAVPVLRPLEVLDGRKSNCPGAVAQREHRDLLALEQLLDHDLVAEGPRGAQRSVELVLVTADEHTFACGEPVGFHNARRLGLRERLGSGDSGLLHDVLRE